MLSTWLSGPRAASSSPSVRPSFGQSVSTTVSKRRGAGGSTDKMVAAEAWGALMSVGIRGRVAPRLEFGEQGLDVGRVLHRAVRAEEQLGGGAQVEVPAQPAPHEAPRALERLERGGPLRFRAQHRDVDLGVLEV